LKSSRIIHYITHKNLSTPLFADIANFHKYNL
jgi:hypothetical protein